MQGYVLNTTLSREEDLIVTILEKAKIYRLYRFYGARHSQIQVGNRIDFSIEFSLKSTIDRLRDVMQISNGWLHIDSKRFIWQRFIKLLNQHLRDVVVVDEFYYKILVEAEKK